MRPIRLLMLAAALTLEAAAAVHFGLLGPIDPFPAAAIPEAIIGLVVMAGMIATFVSPQASWPFALGATLFAVVGTAFGLTFTLPRGELGDVAYHVALLAGLVAAAALLGRRPAASAQR